MLNQPVGISSATSPLMGWVVWPSPRGPRATVSLSEDFGAEALDLVDVGWLNPGRSYELLRPQARA